MIYTESVPRIGKNSELQGWVYSFFKQFYGSVTKSDYIALRLGFVMTHCRGNPKFNFHNYMMRALEADFKKVVGISWYLWAFVVIFLLLNFVGWHTYFWIAFIPFILLLAVGTKLEHIITQLAQEVAEKHIVVEGSWWFNPQITISGSTGHDSFSASFTSSSSKILLNGLFRLDGWEVRIRRPYSRSIFAKGCWLGKKAKKKNKGSIESKPISPKEESPLVFEMQKVNAKGSSSSSPV
ncbi:Tetratricopeptide repeat superfamily protein isoform 1 [Hibiscus syriacus]|uniref:Tetratricopeptide repeat superfamily protein isoform 1 n=1 Tax=Hibiscus syriacus TaxID=106335 RepID=A0A6A3BHQ0_HIBSY|nr:Tetratricopeptide repeat superfamily protein isoform 1 [Hibiscus syriacus]